MGSKTKFSASEAADAFTYMAMAGWKSGDMLDGIEGLMNLAAASGEDLATTSDIVTDALTAFGLKAQDSGHFADILAAASSNANTNVGMMGETFKYAAPIAGALGFSAEDTAVAIGLMANAGIKSSQAGTALRTIMTSLTGEVKISGRALEETTIQTKNADGSMREFGEIIGDLRGVWGNLTEAEQANTAEAIVGKNAMSGFLAIMNATETDMEKLTDAVWECDGAAMSMANTMQDNLAGDITIFKSALEGAQIALSDVLTPALRDFVQWGTDAVSRLTLAFKEDGLSGAISEASEIMGETLATLKDKFEEAFNNAITAISEINWSEVGQNILDWIVGGLQGMSNTFWWLFDKAKAFVQTVNWVEVGLAIVDFVLNGLDALGALMWSNFVKAKEAIKEINWLDVGKAILAFIAFAWLKIKSWAKEKWEKAKAGIQEVNWAEVGNNVKKTVGAAWSTLREWAGKLWEKAKTGIQSVNWAEIGGKVKDAISTAWNALKGWATGLWNSAKAGIEAVNWGEAGNAVLQWFGAAWSQLKTWAQGWWENAKAGIESVDWKDVGNTIWENIKTGVGSLVDNMKKLFETGATGIKNVDWKTLGGDIWDLIKSGLKALGAGFVSLFTDAKDDVGDGTTIDWSGLGSAILDFIFEGMKGIGGLILGLFEAAWEDIQNIPWADLGLVIANWILDGMGGLGDWIREKLDIARVSIEDLDWSGTGKEAASQVVDGMSDLPGDVTELGERAANGFGGGRGGGGGGTAGGGAGRGNVWTRTADNIRGLLRDGISHITTDVSGTADKAASNFGGGTGGGGSSNRWSGAGRNAGNSVSEAFKTAALNAKEAINELQNAINNIKGKTVSINIQQKVTTTNAGAANTKDRNGKISPNARAMDTGYIFRHPTVFAYADNAFQVAGDVGAEAVVGVYSLDKMIQNSVNAAVGRTQAAMVGVLSEILDKMPKGLLVLDTGALVGGIAPEMNNELERITAWSGGGRA